MPDTGNAVHSDSNDIIADLLSEARHLISRERTTGDDNLLQIQQVIEAAQRELCRLRLREEVERVHFRQEPKSVETIIDVGTSINGENESRNNSSDGGEGPPDDASEGVISAMATTGQINIIPARQEAESRGEMRAEAIQTDTPLTEIDLYFGYTNA
jgi:hypothetical protein